MNDFAIMSYAANGMDAQRSALDVLARNVALVETASPGHPVRTLEPQFAVAGDDDGSDDAAEFASALGASGLSGAPGAGDDASADDAAGATFASDTSASADSEMSDAPGDDQLPGTVTYAGARLSARPSSGIDAVTEMVAVLNAQRAYETNATVFDTGKRLIERTLDVERT